jgi:hypothetical protein
MSLRETQLEPTHQPAQLLGGALKDWASTNAFVDELLFRQQILFSFSVAEPNTSVALRLLCDGLVADRSIHMKRALGKRISYENG